MMKKVRIISSPQQDYLLSPDEFRRYSNHMIGWFLVSFAVLFYAMQAVFFFEGKHYFFKIAAAMLSKDREKLEGVFLGMFYFKALACFALSAIPAWYLMQAMTKPVARSQVVSGNILDNSPEVFTHLAQDFSHHELDKSIALLRKEDSDLNGFTKNKLRPYDIFIPRKILELSWIVRGEAGGGKTVFLDRVMKETIDAGHKVILHNIKGDEFEKLKGYCPFYLIEPWNRNAGYAINFMQLLARKREEDRNAYIYAFVNSFFGKASKTDAFFHESAIEVVFALVKKVVEDSLTEKDGKLTCTAGLQDIVNLWVSFQAVEPAPETLTSANAMQMLVQQNQGSLEKIKRLLQEKNPTQADLIDVNNPKTSLCILATCTKTVKKFEVLAKFWGGREKTKSLDLVKWLNDRKDRNVILLSNSNLYVAEAEAYISAIVNLMTMFLINPEYKPTSEVHFILDEFPQLSAIDLKQFMKLPDVGRGKRVRVKIAMQRTSQIKETFGVDSASFAAAFQNKVWARFATDDFDQVRQEMGKQQVREFQQSVNFTAQGRSSSSKTQTKEQDVINPNDLQNELGPIATKNGNFLGVRLLMKFSNFNRVAVATFPPVQFPERFKVRQVARSMAGGSAGTTPAATDKEETLELIETINEDINTIHNEPQHEHSHEESPIGSAVLDVVSHAVVPEPVGMVMQVADLADAMQSTSQNNNTTEIETEIQRKLERLKNKNKNKNREMER